MGGSSWDCRQQPRYIVTIVDPGTGQVASQERVITARSRLMEIDIGDSAEPS